MKKRFLMCFLLLLCSSALFAVMGDANGDDEVNIMDALRIARHYVGITEQPFHIANCDVSGDGAVNIVDALMVAQYYVGLIKEFINKFPSLPTFTSEQELIDAFTATLNNYYTYWIGPELRMSVPLFTPSPGMPMPTSAPAATSAPVENKPEYSETNVQVKGVDEADILKTDGNYIYMLSGQRLVIADSFPPGEARILSETSTGKMTPQEMFVHGDRLMIYGKISYTFPGMYPTPPPPAYYGRYYYYPLQTPFVVVQVYDIADRGHPRLLRNVEIEGNYLSARKIESFTYFVINSAPGYVVDAPVWEDIVPMYRETGSLSTPVKEDMQPICAYYDIGYLRPIQAQRFITVASLDLADDDAVINRQVVVGSGANVYASLENMYIAQTNWNVSLPGGTVVNEDYYGEKTQLYKFAIDSGKVRFTATGYAPGYILNQFSMDEFDNHFRIATTRRVGVPAMNNNIFVLDENLKHTGALEGLAPGEKIYAVRFEGKRGYLVTFVQVDPFFVIDLSDHTNPQVLGELKIPGFSDYLHPYDENHIIGIGKDTNTSALFQGVKLALFDVTDVTNPVQMHQEVIGERGTSSEVLSDHRAFLFDRERNLMVLPITLYEKVDVPNSTTTAIRPTFMGAYVYNLTLYGGFELRGRITHEDNPTPNTYGGFNFNSNRRIRRSLYIEDILYTFSNSRLQLNDLITLDRVHFMEF